MAIPFYFAEITLTAAKLSDVASNYVRWALGTGDPLARQRRIGVGVKPSWQEADALRGEDFTGIDDCSVQTRSDDSLFLLRFRHREANDPVRIWTTAVELRSTPEGLVVRHGAAVTGIIDHRQVPEPATPRVVRDLLSSAGRHVHPRELYRPVSSFSAADATGLVDFVLLEKARRLPVFIVTPLSDGSVLVNPDELSMRTLGMATLYQATNDEASRALNDALVARSVTRRLGCWDGAIRLYAPGLTVQSDPFAHPLWTADRLSRMGASPHGVTLKLSRQFARRELERVTPSEHFQLIEAFDREARKANLVQRRDVVQMTSDARSLVDLAIAENSRLTTDLERVRADYRDKIAEMELREEELEQELSEARAKASALEVALGKKPAVTSMNIDGEALKAMRNLLSGKFTVFDALTAISVAYNDRVVVLESAYASARRSHDFHRPDQAAELLCALAGPYCDALLSGKPEGEAKNAFGRERYASTESETLSQRGRQLRTFLYAGSEVEMLRHVKLGIGAGTATGLRIHFHWDADSRRLVIGHCGRHLDF